MNSIPVLSVVLSTMVLLFGGLASGANHLVKIRAQDPRAVSAALEQRGFDIAGENSKLRTVEVVTERPEVLKALSQQSLRSGSLRLRFSILSVEATRPYSEIRGTREDESYPNAEESEARLRSLESRFPGLAKVFDLNKTLGLPKTAGGRSLLALQVSARPNVIEDEPKLLFVGQHHARELMTHTIVMDAAEDFLSSAARDRRGFARRLTSEKAVWFVPVVNPDGLAYVFSNDRMWRKNRRANAGGQFGVDINRNYPFKWGACGSHSADPRSDVFKGPQAGSEVETQVMDKLNSVLQFQYVISYHSSGNEVLFPYLCGEVAEAPIYNDLRDRLAKELGFGMRKASSSGEDFEHHYARYGSLSFLLEVGDEFQPPFATYRNKVWPNIRKTLPFMLKEMDAPTVELRVVDASTGKPITATLKIRELVFKEGEVRTTDQFGAYRWRLAPGAYSLEVIAVGYALQVVSFQASATSGAKVDVKLLKGRR